jgi:hypothetical protein
MKSLAGKDWKPEPALNGKWILVRYAHGFRSVSRYVYEDHHDEPIYFDTEADALARLERA